MITFAYTPVGSSTATTIGLLDSDRFWPAAMELQWEGEVQTSMPVRALYKTVLGRGLKSFGLGFTATRQHSNLFSAVKYCLQDLPSIAGATGTLMIALPLGAGTLRAVNCVCRSGTGRYLGVRSYASFNFVGPSIGP